MIQLKSILSLVVMVLLAAACTPPSAAVTASPTETNSPATAEPTEEPTMEPEPTETSQPEDTGSGETDSPGEAFDPSALRYPLLQIAEGSSIILTSYGFDYTSDGGLQELTDGYAAAMEPQGCRPYADSGSASGIAAGYLCLGLEDDDLDDFTFSVGFAFEPEKARNVGLSFGSLNSPDFELPIPEDAEDVDDWFTQATFNIPSEKLEDLFLAIEAQGCEYEDALGSTSGGVLQTFVCMDASGRPALTLSVFYESADTTSVRMSFEPLVPQYVIWAFPEGAQDFTYGADHTLAFTTLISFEDVYAFYTPDDEYFTIASGDCTLVGETGGTGGSTALQFFCTGYYSQNFTYDFTVTVVISETENGTAVQMIVKDA